MPQAHKVFAFACFIFGVLLQPSAAQMGQYYPSGCPGTWSNGYCICPDGSLAHGVMGSTAIVCSGSTNYAPQPQIQYCPNGGTCALDQTCCGNQCCGSGSQCSAAGCIPLGAQTCSSGRYCDSGYKCARHGGCIPEENTDCTREFSCRPGTKCYRNKECLTERAIKEKDEAEQKAKQEKKEAELRADIEKKTAAHQKEDASAREKLEKALTGSEQQRLRTEFAKSGTEDPTSELQRLEAMARGENPALAAPTATSPGPDLRVIQGGTAKRVEPSATEQRTVGQTFAPPDSPSDPFKRPTVTGFDREPVPDPSLRKAMEKQAEEARMKAEAERNAAQSYIDDAYAKAREQIRAQQEADARIKDRYTEFDVDSTDCDNFHFDFWSRQQWCATRSKPGARCTIYKITRSCSKSTKDCVESRGPPQDVCR